MPMQHPTNDEAIRLIQMKRQAAKDAMSAILERYGVLAHKPYPGLEVLLAYFSNMVYAVELLLKVMADDWRVPGESQSGHNVGKMYQEVFGQPHPHPTLMQSIRAAIVNQKFIYEPADGLLNLVPELEALWDELGQRFHQDNWGGKHSIEKEIDVPPSFVAFLRNNICRFYVPKYGPYPAGQGPTSDEIQADYQQKVEAMGGMFDWNLCAAGGRMTFGKWSKAMKSGWMLG